MKLKILAAAIAVAFAVPVQAKQPVAPLQVFNAAGKAIGQYVGWGRFSSLQGEERVEAWWAYWIVGDAWGPSVYFETADCSGPAYMEAQPGGLYRDGYLFPNGVLIWPSGTLKVVNSITSRYTSINGIVGECYSVGYSFNGAEINGKFLGAGPFRIR
jgi:hypothetical protein